MRQTKVKLLIAEDQDKMRSMLHDFLEIKGYKVVSASDGELAWRKFQQEDFDLLVLDLMMPKISGLELLQKIRTHNNGNLPIIILTARSDETDRISGLHKGADDYLCKPFSFKELEARIKAQIRRSIEYNTGEEQSPELAQDSKLILQVQDLTLNLASHKFYKNDQELSLTSFQFKIMQVFMQYPSQIFSRAKLGEHISNSFYESFERTIDAHIKNIRKLIEDDPKNPQYIITIRSMGYKLQG